jgi:hypothetical protein
MMLLTILEQKKLFRMNYKSQHYQKLDMRKLNDSMYYEIMYHTHLGVEFAYRVEAATSLTVDSPKNSQVNRRWFVLIIVTLELQRTR